MTNRTKKKKRKRKRNLAYYITSLFSIGRSGRFGKKGVAINFVKSDEVKVLRDIEQYYGTQIDEMPINREFFLFPFFSSLFSFHFKTKQNKTKQKKLLTLCKTF